MTKQIKVTIEFTAGTLKGLTYEREMGVAHARIGYECKKPIGRSPYRVVMVHG